MRERVLNGEAPDHGNPVTALLSKARADCGKGARPPAGRRGRCSHSKSNGPSESTSRPIKGILRRPRHRRAWVAVAVAVAIAGTAVAQSTSTGWFRLVATGTGEEVAAAAVGVDLEARDPWGWTPLAIAAAVNPDPAVIGALISAGANVNAVANIESGETAVFIAAQSTPNINVLRALVSGGANIGTRNPAGATVLDAALGWWPYRLHTPYLVETVLVDASVLDGSRLVLAQSIDPSAIPMEVELFLPDLGFAFSTDLVAIEPDGGAVILEREPPFPPRLTEVVLAFRRFPWPDPTPDTTRASLVRYLLDAGADPHQATANGMTPLMHAAAQGLTEAVAHLLAQVEQFSC